MVLNLCNSREQAKPSVHISILFGLANNESKMWTVWCCFLLFMVQDLGSLAKLTTHSIKTIELGGRSKVHCWFLILFALVSNHLEYVNSFMLFWIISLLSSRLKDILFTKLNWSNLLYPCTFWCAKLASYDITTIHGVICNESHV